jgi:plastocyanin
MKRIVQIVSFVSFAGLLLAACMGSPAAVSGGQGYGTTATSAPTVASSPAGGAGATVDIAIQSFTFTPATLTVAAGTEVKWTNMDSVGHNIVSDDGATIKSPMLAQGESYSQVFNTPGTYAYHCGVHPKMVGTIVVTQ